MADTKRDESQNGLYRNVKTGKTVNVHAILHNYPSGNDISVCFTGTRDGRPFGRAFHDSIENFFDRHVPAGT